MPLASVAVAGSMSATDRAGRALLESLPSGRLATRIEASGFAPAALVVDLRDGDHVGARVTLHRLPPPVLFDADVGARLELDRGVVHIPPAGLVDLTGAPVRGTVEATLVMLDPTERVDTMPGPLQGLPTAGGDPVALASAAMAEVTLTQNGDVVALAPDMSAILELSLPKSASDLFHEGDSIPAWWLDLDQGVWREEGVGVIRLSSADPTEIVWSAEVRHFTWWNCDVAPPTGCIDVLLLDVDGEPVAGVPVSAVMTEPIAGSSTAYTGPDGRACVTAPVLAEIALVAGFPGNSLAPVTKIGMSSGVAACGSELCRHVKLQAPKPKLCTPGSYTSCSYDGPSGSEGVGVCRAARAYCAVDGMSFHDCQGETTPGTENCNTPFDEDCDGQVNEDGAGCDCTAGNMKACFGGPPDALGVGSCVGGTQACQSDGTGYGVCEGQTLPVPESCATPQDDDCDGSTECSGVPIWSRRFGTQKGISDCDGLSDDGAGGMLVLAGFQGDLSFGGSLVTHPGYGDKTLVRFDATGRYIFERTFLAGDASGWFEARLFTDEASNIFLGGSFDGTVDVGSGPVNAGSGRSFFVTKLDPAGKTLWSKSFKAGQYADMEAMPDHAGGVLVAGGFVGTVGIGGQTFSSSGTFGVVVGRFDPSGQHLWSRAFTAELDSFAPTPDQGTLVAGFYSGTVDFGDAVLTDDLFASYLVAFDGSGKYKWSKSIHNAESLQVTVDSVGNIGVLGRALGPLDLGGGEVANPEGLDGFVAKLDPGGAPLWARTFDLWHASTETSFAPRTIRFDTAGDLVMFGNLNDVGDILGSSWSSAGEHDVAIAKIDSTGNLVWAHRFGDADLQLGRHLAIDPAGDLLVCGTFGGKMRLGPSLLVPRGYLDLFIARLSP